VNKEKISSDKYSLETKLLKMQCESAQINEHILAKEKRKENALATLITAIIISVSFAIAAKTQH